jgi:hypothetical protein
MSDRVETKYNIKDMAESLACRDTAQYVMDNDQLSKAEQIEGKEECLNWAIDKSPNNGLCLEFGVGFGGTLKKIAKRRAVHGFDSFKGLPESWRSGLPKGTFSRAGMVADDLGAIEGVTLHRGLFDESIPIFEREYHSRLTTEGIAFVHVDSDLYGSACTVLEFVGKYLKNRSIILFDEYFNWPGWQLPRRGEHAALMEWNVIGWKYVAYNIEGQDVAIRMVQE